MMVDFVMLRGRKPEILPANGRNILCDTVLISAVRSKLKRFSGAIEAIKTQTRLTC